MIAPALRGPVLDVGCGDGRLASLVRAGVSWIGVDSSAAQLGANGGELPPGEAGALVGLRVGLHVGELEAVPPVTTHRTHIRLARRRCKLPAAKAPLIQAELQGLSRYGA
jgi:SAM-dependent methyltransferase